MNGRAKTPIESEYVHAVKAPILTEKNRAGCRKIKPINPTNQYAHHYSSEYKKEWRDYLKINHLDHCWKCGYNKCFAAIDFHHVNPGKKEKSVSRFLWGKITPEGITEIEKTIPLCARCHRELHAGLWNIIETHKEMNRHKVEK